jgi:hypothetical protein
MDKGYCDVGLKSLPALRKGIFLVRAAQEENFRVFFEVKYMSS